MWYQKAKKDLDDFLEGGTQNHIDSHASALIVIDTLLPLPIKSLNITYSKDVSEIYITIEIENRTICYNVDGLFVDHQRVR